MKGFLAFVLFSDRSLNDSGVGTAIQNILDQLNEAGFVVDEVSADGDPFYHEKYAPDNLKAILDRYREGRYDKVRKSIAAPESHSVCIGFIPDPVHLGKVLRKRFLKYILSVNGWDSLIADALNPEYVELFTNCQVLDPDAGNSQSDEYPLTMFNFKILKKLKGKL